MRNTALCACLAALASSGGARAAEDLGPSPIAAGTHQLVVVTTGGWEGKDALVTRWQRAAGGKWRRAGGEAAVRAVVGHAGLGWGAGLHSPALATRLGGPAKREGDGRAPAGVFRLVEATGYAATPPTGTTLRYRRATERLRCVDDPTAPQYNQLIESAADGTHPWRSDEAMLRSDELYRWVIVVEHNRGPVSPGGGSCIFLHVWKEDGAPTIGCTAMAPTDIASLLAWLDAPAQPLLVQLPREVYRRLAARWNLPPSP